MAEAIKVSRAEAGDRADWMRLWLLWQRHMSGTVPQEVSERTWRLALQPESDLLILLARTSANDAIGFATMSFAPFAWTGSDIAFLQDLFVLDRERGKGVGDALLKAVYAQADARGVPQVYWMVDERDRDLQRFYARHGIRTPYLRYMRAPWPW